MGIVCDGGELDVPSPPRRVFSEINSAEPLCSLVPRLFVLPDAPSIPSPSQLNKLLSLELESRKLA